jgi:hypothetical protein
MAQNQETRGSWQSARVPECIRLAELNVPETSAHVVERQAAWLAGRLRLSAPTARAIAELAFEHGRAAR